MATEHVTPQTSETDEDALITITGIGITSRLVKQSNATGLKWEGLFFFLYVSFWIRGPGLY